MAETSENKLGDKANKTLSISVIIPARDEALAIGRIISQVKESLASLNYEIILVDDGSRDGTKKICATYGVIVASHPVSLGKGAAMKTGAEKAKGDIVVFMDGDGQHRPSEIPRLINPIIQNRADFVIGSRTLPESEVTITPVTRKWSNSLASFLISFIISFILPLRTAFKSPFRWTTITDCTSGFRAVRKSKWQQLHLLSNGFEIETEMILEAARHRLVIKEAPISCTWDTELSRLSVLRDGLKTLRLLLGKLIRNPH